MRMARLTKAIKTILNNCMQIKKGESVLIITDNNKIDLAESLLKEAHKITKANLINIPIGERHGEEPSKNIAEEMKRYDAILILTTYSLTHTKASRDAAKKGARIASMPGVTEEMMKRAIDVDYKEIERQTKRLKEILDKGNDVRVTTKKGTDLSFSIKGRKAEYWEGIKKGMIKNLPTGESFLAPVEGTANGRFVIDGSVLSFKIENPITVEVKNGFATNIKGGNEADLLRKVLENVKDKNAFNIAEFGIGTNPKAKITGNVLEDEKVKGTCHLAFGNNVGFGGKTDVPIHIDGIILKPTIFVDGKIIIKDGKLIV
ncbi:aminopeptidase [Candidatus Woesearchaeota archaeon]|nr:aminopeptidase [Candidatus Woesearchaeota archaeon]